MYILLRRHLAKQAAGSWLKHRRSNTFVALLLSVFVVILAGCEKPVTQAPEPTSRPAKLHKVTPQSTQVTLSLPGIFDAAETSTLAFQVAGQVASVAVREGQELVAGAEIARLDQRDFANELKTSRARLEAASSEFDRAKSLIADGAISQSMFEQLDTEFDLATTAFERAQKRLEDTVLRAPYDGVVANLHIEAFENVASQSPVVTIQSEGLIQAIVQVPSTLVANQANLIEIETVVLLDSAPGVIIPGTLYSVSGRADPTGQTFEARVAFEPPADLTIRPGMTGTVQSIVEIAAVEAKLKVPMGSVLSDGENQYVWLVDMDSMTVSRRPVTIGIGTGELLPVEDGLKAGDTIVAAGVALIHEGMKIKPYEN